MKITNVRIEDLKPFDKNPRDISDDAVEVVARSIKEFGFNQPIMTDQNLRICVGHTRYLAAKKLGLKEVPVFSKKMSEEKFLAYNIGDNKTGEFSTWNKKTLMEAWDDLAKWPELQEATALEAWEVEPLPEKSDAEKGKSQGERRDENLFCLELIYTKEDAKKIKEMCQAIDPEASLEDTIYICVKEIFGVDKTT